MKTAVIRLADTRTLFFIHRFFVHGPFTLPSDARGIFPFFIYPSMHFNPACFTTTGEGKTRVVRTLSDRKNRGEQRKKKKGGKKEKARGQGFYRVRECLIRAFLTTAGRGGEMAVGWRRFIEERSTDRGTGGGNKRRISK